MSLFILILFLHLLSISIVLCYSLLILANVFYVYCNYVPIIFFLLYPNKWLIAVSDRVQLWLHILCNQYVNRTTESTGRVVWYTKLESIVQVQHEFRCQYGVWLPNDKSIWRWCNQFRVMAVWGKRHSTRQPRRSDGDVDCYAGFHTESKQADLPSMCRVIDDANNCPQNSLEKPMSKTWETMGSPETYSM
jgi:hypothetical protein